MAKVKIQTIEVIQSLSAATIKKLYKDTLPLTEAILSLNPLYPDYDGLTNLNDLMQTLKRQHNHNEAVRKNYNAEPQKFTRTNNAMHKPLSGQVEIAEKHADDVRSEFKDAQVAEELRRERISISKGGDGSNIKDVDTAQDHTRSSRIPDHKLIQNVIDEAAKTVTVKFPLEIPGIMIFPVWNFQVIDSPAVPNEYRKYSFTDG